MAQTKYIIRLIDRASRTARTIQKNMAGITAQAKIAGGAINTVGLIAGGAAVAGIFKLGAELESTTILFETLSGSVEKGTKLFEDLTKFANETPFSNQALNKNAQTLLAFGQEADDVINILKTLGDVSSGDQNRLQSLTLAFAQSQAAGRLMGQDLLQMVNAGFNPLQEISRKTGESMAVLKKKMEQGAISADLVRKAFESAAGPGGRFYGMTERMSQSMAGKWSTALGKGKFLIAEFGLSLKDIFLPALNSVIGMIDRMSKFLSENKENIKVWVGWILKTVPVILTMVAALKIFNAVAAANPYVLLALGAAALIGLLIQLSTQFNKTRDVINAFFDNLGAGFSIVMLPLEAIWEILKGIVGIFKAFKFDGFIGGIMQVGKSILSFILLPLEKVLKVAAGFGVGQKAFDDLKAFRDSLDFVQPESATAKTKSKTGIDTGTTGTLGVDLSQDLKKLQAEGVVSGGIKTFNINIAGVTGINTLQTTTIEESANKAGQAVMDALLGALADIKNIG